MHHVSRFAFAAHKRGAGYKVWISTAELRKPYKRADLLSMIRMMHKVVFYKPKLKAARSSWTR